MRLKNPPGRFFAEYFPVSFPPASGVYVMSVMPNSRHAARLKTRAVI